MSPEFINFNLKKNDIHSFCHCKSLLVWTSLYAYSAAVVAVGHILHQSAGKSLEICFSNLHNYSYDIKYVIYWFLAVNASVCVKQCLLMISQPCRLPWKQFTQFLHSFSFNKYVNVISLLCKLCLGSSARHKHLFVLCLSQLILLWLERFCCHHDSVRNVCRL